MIKRPEKGEYNPYYEAYIQLVPDGSILSILERQIEETDILLKGLSESQANFRYRHSKWSIKEVIGHLADTERVFAYRVLSFARGDAASLPGFDENAYVKEAGFDAYPLSALLGSFKRARLATLGLVSLLPEEAWLRTGTSNGHPASVRALVFTIAGHELHHRKILMERYIGAGSFPQW